MALAVAASLVALAVPPSQAAAPVFVLDRQAVQPHERVTVRSATFEPGVRLYLVQRGAVPAIRSRLDRRLSFIGTLARDSRGRGTLVFGVPPLAAGAYELASWSRRRGVSVQRSARLELRSTPSCPVTLPNGNRPPGQPRGVPWYGNGLLWAGVARKGTLTVPADQVEADGTIGEKLLWVTTPPAAKPAVSGERIDGDAPPLWVSRVNTNSSSHMTPVRFSTPGCWRVQARLGDVSLVYVVQVVVAE